MFLAWQLHSSSCLGIPTFLSSLQLVSTVPMGKSCSFLRGPNTRLKSTCKLTWTLNITLLRKEIKSSKPPFFLDSGQRPFEKETSGGSTAGSFQVVVETTKFLRPHPHVMLHKLNVCRLDWKSCPDFFGNIISTTVTIIYIYIYICLKT